MSGQPRKLATHLLREKISHTVENRDRTVVPNAEMNAIDTQFQLLAEYALLIEQGFLNKSYTAVYEPAVNGLDVALLYLEKRRNAQVQIIKLSTELQRVNQVNKNLQAQLTQSTQESERLRKLTMDVSTKFNDLVENRADLARRYNRLIDENRELRSIIEQGGELMANSETKIIQSLTERVRELEAEQRISRVDGARQSASMKQESCCLVDSVAQSFEESDLGEFAQNGRFENASI